MTYEIHLPSMNCEHCKMRIEAAISSLCQSIHVDQESKIVKTESERPSGEILSALEKAGYPGSLVN